MKLLLLKALEAILYFEAGLFRAKVSGPVVAIVGSVGKTGVKDAVALIVRQAFGSEATFVTYKSLNAELGVPLTLLGFRDLPHNLGWIVAIAKGLLLALWGVAPKAVVVELGEENPGDLAHLARLARPTVLIITDVSEAHSAYLGTIKAIWRESLSVLPFVSETGTIIVNGDNDGLRNLKVAPGQTKIVVRLGSRADYFASAIRIGMGGTTALIGRANRIRKVTIKRWGHHHMYAVLFMAALGDCLGVSLTHQRSLFKSLKPAPGRGTMFEGKRGSTIFDESYNAQPAAMRAALLTLGELPARRKVAILGDMRELAYPAAHHLEIGQLAHNVADYVIGVGPLSKDYKPDEWFPSSTQAIGAALNQLGPGVIVLIKGSQNTIRLERVVEALLKHPSDVRYLVRQEREWRNTP